jgi:hypothetical protein
MSRDTRPRPALVANRGRHAFVSLRPCLSRRTAGRVSQRRNRRMKCESFQPFATPQICSILGLRNIRRGVCRRPEKDRKQVLDQIVNERGTRSLRSTIHLLSHLWDRNYQQHIPEPRHHADQAALNPECAHARQQAFCTDRLLADLKIYIVPTTREMLSRRLARH